MFSRTGGRFISCCEESMWDWVSEVQSNDMQHVSWQQGFFLEIEISHFAVIYSDRALAYFWSCCTAVPHCVITSEHSRVRGSVSWSRVLVLLFMLEMCLGPVIIHFYHVILLLYITNVSSCLVEFEQQRSYDQDLYCSWTWIPCDSFNAVTGCFWVPGRGTLTGYNFPPNSGF